MSVTLTGDSASKNVHAGEVVVWPLQVSSDASEVIVALDMETGPDPTDSPEWSIALNDSAGELWSNYRSKNEIKIDIPGKNPKELKLEVTCPNGARYGDVVSVKIVVSASGESQSTEFKARAIQSIMVLKTQIDQEKSVVDSLYAKANLGEKDIYAILSPANLRGYLFVEGMNTDRMRERTRDIKKARSFVKGETSLSEIDHYLTPLSTVVGIVEGDLVELINGPFRGEKARVQQIDQSKEEITVELVEAMVPIPVTVKGDSVRVIEKER